MANFFQPVPSVSTGAGGIPSEDFFEHENKKEDINPVISIMYLLEEITGFIISKIAQFG